MKYIFLALLTLIIGQSCSIQTAPFPEIKETPNVTYSVHIEPIVKDACLKCHSDFDYDKLVYLQYAVYQKITVDKTMPMNQFMDDSKRALFRDWIVQGMKP